MPVALLLFGGDRMAQSQGLEEVVAEIFWPPEVPFADWRVGSVERRGEACEVVGSLGIGCHGFPGHHGVLRRGLK